MASLSRALRRFTLAACAALPALTGACADDASGGLSVATTPLAGKVNGQAWTFETGTTNAFLSGSGDTYFATLYAVDFAGCGQEPFDNVPSLIVRIPKTVGSSNFSLKLNGTFTYGGTDGPENLVATNGTIVVDEITDTTITAGVHMIYDANNAVDGRFTATICK